MNSYEELLEEADESGLLVKETFLQSADGRCKGNRIAVRRDMPTLAKKADVLAEELGHYYTTVGRIIEQDTVESRKQERRARLWAYSKRIGLSGLIKAYKEHCHNQFEIAECLNVSEEFLEEALNCYREVYGAGYMMDNYFVQFEPSLQVYEYFTV